ncbi:MAG: DNA-processing protein DprA [Candidatus Delongbacteria bacterium]
MRAEELARLCSEEFTRGRRPRPGQGALPLAGPGAADWLERELDPRGPRRANWEALAEELGRGSLALVRPGDAAYPPLLGAMAAPPDPLFCKGRLELAQREAVAIVGTRRPDERGLRWTARAAEALARLGLVVVSGGAAGIDGQAHRRAGSAQTVAVLGAGFDRPYPAEHRELFRELGEQGLLLSEWPPWTGPETWRFPRRNRVIAGLCRAVLVAQAPARSGALSTAHHAVEEGREVLVCPGPWDEPLYAGCHKLIRQGARLTATLDDLLEELSALPLILAPLPPRLPEPSIAPSAGEGDRELWELLERPLCRDELGARLGLASGPLATRLLEAELAGWLRALPGDRWARCNWTGA